MPSDTSTDLDRAHASTVATQHAEQELLRFMQMTDDEVKNLDPESTARAMLLELLEAETLDELIGSRDTVGGENYIGQPFTLLRVKFQPSQYEGDGPGFYVVLNVVTADGEKLAITSSARQIMLSAWKMRDRGWLPVEGLQIQQTKRPTAAGYFPQWLERAPAGF